ncbi:MAG: hypothetical protein JNL67_22820 [Planctomycetaceae bacterium]|nr:hypothetical protein [Planctomycetaceae bacterium]
MRCQSLHRNLWTSLCLSGFAILLQETSAQTISDDIDPTTPPVIVAETKPLPFVVIDSAKGIVPGSGILIDKVGDDFEESDWSCKLNLPKSSEEIDGQVRSPGASVKNGRWYEGVKRGVPDVVERVATPAGGLPGSNGALLLRSLQTGVPKRLSYQNQQDDFVCDVESRLGGRLPVSQCPSAVTRVYLPPFEQWGQRAGAHFGFRLSLGTTKYTTTTSSRGRYSSPAREQETYWPGLFADLVPANKSKSGKTEYVWRVRSDSRGLDFPGKPIETSGWWTLGISVTPNGQVHYYAKPGVEDLTLDDHIISQFPYNYRAEHFKTFFFNIINGDDGKNWSTPMIVDDSRVYFLDAEQLKTAANDSPASFQRR